MKIVLTQKITVAILMKVIDIKKLMILRKLESFQYTLVNSIPVIPKTFEISNIINSISNNVDSPLKGFVQYFSLMEGRNIKNYDIEDTFLKKMKYNRWG